MERKTIANHKQFGNIPSKRILSCVAVAGRYSQILFAVSVSCSLLLSSCAKEDPLDEDQADPKLENPIQQANGWEYRGGTRVMGPYERVHGNIQLHRVNEYADGTVDVLVTSSAIQINNQNFTLHSSRWQTNFHDQDTVIDYRFYGEQGGDLIDFELKGADESVISIINENNYFEAHPGWDLDYRLDRAIPTPYSTYGYRSGTLEPGQKHIHIDELILPLEGDGIPIRSKKLSKYDVYTGFIGTIIRDDGTVQTAWQYENGIRLDRSSPATDEFSTGSPFLIHPTYRVADFDLAQLIPGWVPPSGFYPAMRPRYFAHSGKLIGLVINSDITYEISIDVVTNEATILHSFETFFYDGISDYKHGAVTDNPKWMWIGTEGDFIAIHRETTSFEIFLFQEGEMSTLEIPEFNTELIGEPNIPDFIDIYYADGILWLLLKTYGEEIYQNRYSYSRYYLFSKTIE